MDARIFAARNPSVVRAAPLNERAVPTDGSLTPQNIMLKPSIDRTACVPDENLEAVKQAIIVRQNYLQDRE